MYPTFGNQPNALTGPDDDSISSCVCPGGSPSSVSVERCVALRPRRVEPATGESRRFGACSGASRSLGVGMVGNSIDCVRARTREANVVIGCHASSARHDAFLTSFNPLCSSLSLAGPDIQHRLVHHAVPAADPFCVATIASRWPVARQRTQRSCRKQLCAQTPRRRTPRRRNFAVREICVTFCGNRFCRPRPSSATVANNCQ